ncbi:4-alpha-glucanotransferase [candidate division CSSED10-310 bacterium]|uniref:4-alpha-glucanotransferase n=1 Tax=candidate division CSSED10-310 bacterium TaxID=2855610 RepID=A0ABV6YQW6_UNCC1
MKKKADARYNDRSTEPYSAQVRDKLAARWPLPTAPSKSAGVMVPLFSLRSATGLGVGEIPDLKHLIKWCTLTGLKLIQLLPLNDTGLDPSPYSAVSSMALNPVYLALPKIYGWECIKDELQRTRPFFNAQDRFDYKKIRALKLALLSKIFSEQRSNLSASTPFRDFRERNQWLIPYAVFCVLKERYEHQWWREWPDRYQQASPEVLTEITVRFPGECLFHQFIQWELEKQLSAVHQAAREAAVILKGDMPILMNDDSVDVWLKSDYFHDRLRAGAPPDMFSDEGQNWGFPIYRWEVLEKDDFSWWNHRLQQMGKFYDAVRIDHVLGFFRIWAIPKWEKTARLGYFVPSRPLNFRTLQKLGLTLGDLERLTTPHFTKKKLHTFLGPSAPRMMKEYFTRFSKRGNYRFSPHIQGEKDFQAVADEDPELFVKLSKLWADRLLIQDAELRDNFAFRWDYKETRVFKSLKRQTRQALVALAAGYDRKHNRFWKQNGRKLLSMILTHSEMLICAEDLGYVPPVVRPLLNELGILSLKVERWTRDYQKSPASFISPSRYPLMSVCTPSVHDTTTLRGWWEETPSETEQYHRLLGLSGPPPAYLTTEIAALILQRNLKAGSILTVFALQDFFSLRYDLRTYHPETERVNIPGLTSDQNWSWRMGISLEELLGMTEFSSVIRTMLRERGRL